MGAAGTAALAFNITGLSCEQPPGADALGGGASGYPRMCSLK